MLSHCLARLRRLLADEQGPTATEYAVMLALIIIAAIAAITSVGTNMSGIFTNVSTAMVGG